MVKRLSGTDNFKVNVFWSDAKHRDLGFNNDWQSVQTPSRWTKAGFSAVAPNGAKFARVHLASGDGTETLFAGISMRDQSQPGIELLPNGGFTNGPTGWAIVDKPNMPLEIIAPRPTDVQVVETAADFPDLFAYFRQYLSVSALSNGEPVRRRSSTLPSSCLLSVGRQQRLTIPEPDWQRWRLLSFQAYWL
jgi:hypothetical protein